MRRGDKSIHISIPKRAPGVLKNFQKKVIFDGVVVGS